MKSFWGSISRWTGCASVALLVVGMLAARPQGAFADDTGGGGSGVSITCPDNACGGQFNTSCDLYNGAPGGCANSCCALDWKKCDCGYANNLCTCP